MTALQTASETFAINPADRLIAALDVPTAEEALAIVRDLEGCVDTFKVGLQLFTAAGRGFVEQLVGSGKRVFLDLKFHDIPNTVAMASIEAAKMGVWMFNVHAGGGSEMMATAASAVDEFCSSSGSRRPLMIGVTVLTSSNVSTLMETGIEAGLDNQVERLAGLAVRSGLDGVVASANESKLIRSAVTKNSFLIVTPGIRPSFATNDDQKRVMTPAEAIAAGSNYIVVGRPIIAAADRRKAAEQIVEEIAVQ